MQTSVLQRKSDMRDMGANLKQLVANNTTTEGEYYGIQFIRPKDIGKSYVAKAVKEDGEHSYIIVLHFNDIIQHRIREKDKLTDEIIDQAMNEFTLANLS